MRIKKSKLKLRLASLFVLAAMMLPQMVQFIQSTYMIGAWAEVVAASTATTYFYNQLESGNEKKFYDAFVTMHQKGFLRQGNVSIKVDGLDYTEGQEQKLLDEMGAARDAFWLDHADIFYVDFDQLSLKISDGEVYVGTGRSDTYINKEFLKTDGTVDSDMIKDAINAVNSRVEAAVREANTKSSVKEKVRVAHDAVIKAAKYTLEYETQHPYSVRTVYGVFGLGEANNAGNAVCEGYARALKMILDRLGIVSILVRGVYMDKNVPQEHMWLYVQDGGKWYAVDVTFDNGFEDKGTISKQYDYFMVGGDVMDEHYPTGVISTSNKEFTYPALEGDLSNKSTENKDACRLDTSEACAEKQKDVVYENASGLRIEYAGEEHIGGDNDKTGSDAENVYHISYKGMGWKDAAKQGDYIIINEWQIRLDAGTQENVYIPSDWMYPSDEQDYQKIYEDHGSYFSVKMDNLHIFQVAVTNIKPSEDKKPENCNGLCFEKGVEPEMVVMSQMIETGKEIDTFPQPFIRRTTPAHTLKQKVGRTYHVEVEYDQQMKISGGELGYKLLLFDHVYGYREPNEDDQKRLDYRIENLKLSDDGYTITYDFTPSKMWELDETLYIVTFTNIVGIKSGKAPNSVEYAVSNPVTGCIYQLRAMNADLEVFAKPALLDDFDINDIVDSKDLGMTKDEFDAYMQKYGDLLTSRLTLVVTEPGVKENAELNSMLDEALDKDAKLGGTDNITKHVSTYNITLSLCAKFLASIKDGERLRLKVGFPDGYVYSPDDEGTTFRAYHYAKQDDGTYEIEEIECTVTQYGLIIYVSSFSPFAVVALEGDDGTKLADSEMVSRAADMITLTTTAGGKVTEKGYDSQLPAVVEVNKNETKTLVAVADSDYVIEEMTLNGTPVAEAAGKDNHEFEAKASDKVFVSFVTTKETQDIADPEEYADSPDEDLIDQDWEQPGNGNNGGNGGNSGNGGNNNGGGSSNNGGSGDNGSQGDKTETSIKKDTPQTATAGDGTSVEAIFGKDVAGAKGIDVESKNLADFKKATEENPNLKLVYDIFAVDENGKPLGKSISDNNIKITLKIPENVLDNKTYDNYKIVYINKDGEIEETIELSEPMKHKDNHYYLTFNTTHLSYYGVVAYNNDDSNNGGGDDDGNGNAGNGTNGGSDTTQGGSNGTTNNPATSNKGNNVLTSVADDRFYIIIAIASLLGIVLVATRKKTV